MTSELFEMRFARDGARRAIPWEDIASIVDPIVRRAVGAEWLGRMEQEHLAVGAFSRLTTEVAEDGADETVLWLLARAAADEVRHADVCRRVAALLLGEAAVPRRFRGLPKLPEHEGASSGSRALLHVVEMCCLSETVTGVWFTEALARATHPTMRAVFESLLEDEIDHGRVGWAYLASRVSEGRAKSLSKALPDMLDRTIGRSLARPRTALPDEAAIEALGSLSYETGRATIRRALADVILPGFETLGIDLDPARAHVESRAWLSV